MSAPTPTDPGPPGPPPLRGLRTMGAIRWAIVAVAAGAALWSWSSYVLGQHVERDGAGATQAARYHCPMHPEVVSPEPGECPICHMDLVPFEPPPALDAGAGSTPPAGAAGGARRASSARATAAGDAGREPEPGALPPGTAPITLAFDRLQAIGVRTALAEARAGDGALRVSAVVSAPETGVAEVHVRAAGFVERVAVRETGVKVAPGQELVALYSPEAFQAASELAAAKAFGDDGKGTVDAARRRLELLGVPAPTIAEIVRTGQPLRTFPVVAPAGGYVTRKNVVLGSYVTPETALYEIADLARVWVVADVFARDLAELGVGTSATFVPAGPLARRYPTKIELVYPQVSAEARTTRVRLSVPNERLELRPGQYGTIELPRRSGAAVVVPRDALVDTGTVAYVFVEQGAGAFVPRVVRPGAELGEVTEIAEGLTAGERVVSGATFLVDAESRLRAAVTAPAATPLPPPEPR